MRTRSAIATIAAALAVIAQTELRAYVLNGPVWGFRPVPYVINTTNMDLPEDAVETAVRAGADVWPQQAHTAFSFQFSGRSTQTTTGYDSVNLIVFRNASSGSAIATTYWWSSGSNLLDADIVFWDGGFQFFAGTTGCVNGFYIEDIAAHEFGHALGLGHSASTAATMYASVAYCDQSNRTLDADDIAGVLALYPAATLSAPLNVRIVPGL